MQCCLAGECFFLLFGVRNRFQPAYHPEETGIVAICKILNCSVLRYFLFTSIEISTTHEWGIDIIFSLPEMLTLSLVYSMNYT